MNSRRGVWRRSSAVLQVAVQEAGGARQVLVRGLDDLFVAVDAEVHLRRAQVRRRVDVGDRDQRRRQRLVFDFARQEIGDLLAQQVVDAFDATADGMPSVTQMRSLEYISMTSPSTRSSQPSSSDAALEALADFGRRRP